jgi:hypothetical protein
MSSQLLRARCSADAGSESLPAGRTCSLSKRPFKGKEARPTFAGECESVRDALVQRGQRLLAQATARTIHVELPIDREHCAGPAADRQVNSLFPAVGVSRQLPRRFHAITAVRERQ